MLNMQKYILSLGLLLLLFGCQDRVAEFDGYQLEEFEIASANTGQDYRIEILRPNPLDAGRTYPFVFLIDGHWHFPAVGQSLRRLHRNEELEPIVLVSIAFAGLNPNGLEGYSRISELRIDDLTSVKNSSESEFGGKSQAFRDFIQFELLPRVQADYPENPQERTLMGHSLGGYFGLWNMLIFEDSSRLFPNIHAGSPALWWADGHLMEVEAQRAESLNDLPVDLHTTMGSLESVVWNTFFDEFEERMNSRDYESFSHSFERYPRGHSANAAPGFEEALKYFFSK